mgnify:CR=1 FL=1
MLFLVVSGTEIHGGIALLVGTELVVLAGQNSVHEDANQRSNSQAGQADGDTADGMFAIVDGNIEVQ